MNKEQALERLCALMSKVAAIQFKNAAASDCICAKTSPHSGPPVIEEVVLSFIENSVTITLMGMDGETPTHSLTPDETTEAERDPRGNGRLYAIKAIRRRLDVGLYEAKQIVDAHLKRKGLL